MSKRNDSSFAEKLSSIRENHPILLKAILILIVLIVVFRLFVLPTLSAIRISSGESASENRVYNAVAVPSSKEVPQNNSTINANDAEERVESNAAEVAPDVIATGTRDGCTWTVEADGDLIIAPTDGISGVITSTTGYAHPERSLRTAAGLNPAARFAFFIGQALNREDISVSTRVVSLSETVYCVQHLQVAAVLKSISHQVRNQLIE